jgi:hypothetical protein
VVARNDGERVYVLILEEPADVAIRFRLRAGGFLNELNAVIQSCLVDVAHGGDPAVPLRREDAEHFTASSAESGDSHVDPVVGACRSEWEHGSA